MKVPAGERLDPRSIARIRHPELRRAAQEALARGEEVRLLVAEGEAGRVETLIWPGSARAIQSAGSRALWGQWHGERLHTADGGHLLSADGTCVCEACELAAGYFGDDDE